MLPRNKDNTEKQSGTLLCRMGLLAALTLLPAPGRAQSPARAQPPAAGKKTGGYTINVDVNLVVLHATVIDKSGRPVNDLKQGNFRVYENGALQQLAVFSHADIPVTLGIVIDDSGSMRDKRTAVNAAALTFVKTSNPQDQAFVVNFNDVNYLDTPGDFASNIEELKAGFEELIEYARKSTAVIYTIALLGEEQPDGLFKIKHGTARRAAKVLEQLAQATGGQPFYPKSLEEVESNCVQIARDIRSQYTLAYYPTNAKKDGTFRPVRVDVVSPRNRNRITVRTRPGYYAPKPDQPSSLTSGQ
ncbi:MAG: VWA domain-containing protein [Acidobacteria bacterium]|nr:MAG: VWA domain-containing protein [Acidobacteriota bacterium]